MVSDMESYMPAGTPSVLASKAEPSAPQRPRHQAKPTALGGNTHYRSPTANLRLYRAPKLAGLHRAL